ncbi:hypothetical protein PLESTB_000480200 [Pleodorina starrii]|uniref:DNA-(apurinic or apyrimidinic site) endonuclease n=1 Tax=Pleodorina starrii TaxID=330485 RepID=A0A9W6BFM2_9CHLO|nr:hypothetical protein PLESTM_001586400 [Pleodorina starrii]GLC51229.1 hypothetical protein PLESTB_000480200 [Pleodorina starrii]GLC63587.1 hypothetical protein PLESTF_000052500 [Pleodorina starrii]
MIFRQCGRVITATPLYYWRATRTQPSFLRAFGLHAPAEPKRRACAPYLSSPLCRQATPRATAPVSPLSVPSSMETGSPRARRASASAARKQPANAAAGAAGSPAHEPAGQDAELQAAVPRDGGDDDGTAAAAPPPAKRARKESQSTRSKAGASADDSAIRTAAGDTGAAGAGPKPAAARARKSRSKAAAAAAAPEGNAGAAAAGDGADGDEEPTLLGDRAAKPAAKAKRGQKAEPLPQYTATLRKPPPPEGAPVLKILSWNVAGLRALLKKQPDAISSLVEREGAEVVCLQEHKLQGNHTVEMEAALGLKGWHHHWACSTGKLGYSGVSVHTRSKPLSVTVGLGGCEGAMGEELPDPEHELEGRVVTVELPSAFVVSVYVPNSGEGLKRLEYRVQRWDGAFAAFIQRLEARGKPVIVTGDLNCAHQEIDIHAPKTNLRSAGFTVEERESFGRLLLGEVGLVDTFRALYPDTVGYTYFTRRFNCRAQNKGWRLDYFLTSGSLMPSTATTTTTAVAEAAAEQQPAPEAPNPPAAAGAAAATPTAVPSTPWRVYDSWILQDMYGSDHLPLGLTLTRGPE